MRSSLPTVERLDDVVPVRGVDPEQRQHHEPDGATLGLGASLHPAPQVLVDVPQHVVEHLHGSTRNLPARRDQQAIFPDHLIISRPSADPLPMVSVAGMPYLLCVGRR